MVMIKVLKKYCKNEALIIFVIAFVVRITFTIILHNFTDLLSNGFYTSAAGEYRKITLSLLQGNGYAGYRDLNTPSAHHPPFYSVLILWPLWKTFGMGIFSQVLLQIIQGFISSCTCILVFKLASKLFNRRIGIYAGIGYALFPTAAYMSNEFHPISIFIFIYVLYVFMYHKIINRSYSNFDLILLSICSGLLLLIRTDILVIVILFNIYLIRFIKLNKIALVWLAFIIIVSPWLIRNYITFDKIVLSSKFGLNLWKGQGEEASGYAYKFNGDRVRNRNIESIKHDLELTNDLELRIDKLYLDATIKYLKKNPTSPIKLLPEKLFGFWVYDTYHPKANNIIYKISYLILLFLFMIGLIRICFNFKKEYFLLLIPIIFGTVLISVFFTLPRYRMSIDQFVIIIACYGFEYGFRYSLKLINNPPVSKRRISKKSAH
jgi:4-amino-4-deoxy-L-arabinose transferase-like glycosyltransferase